MPAGSTARTSSRVLKGGPSKLRGVIWHKSNGKWEARIYEAGKQRFLGYFTSEVAAAKAYDARAVQLHGSNAKVNFPEDHYETRNNPPAVKSFCALAVPTPAKEEEQPHTRRPANGTTTASASRRVAKRKDNSGDEDYILPSQSRSRRIKPQYSLRPPACKRFIDNLKEESDSEDSLEQGAVEVLATLLSNSDQDGSWRSSTGSAVKWSTWGGETKLARANSPPTASTGTSPAPAPKLGLWTPPLFVQQADVASTESHSQALGSLQACAQARLKARSQAIDDYAESYNPSLSRACSVGAESCSDSEHMSASLQSGLGGSYRQRKTSNNLQNAFSGPLDQIEQVQPVPAGRAHVRESNDSEQQGMPGFLQPANHSIKTPEKPCLASARSISSPIARVQEATAKAASVPRVAPFTGARSTRGSSRFRGVSWCEKGQKWRALLWDGNRQHFLGHFKSEEEGARAYDRALLTRKKKDGCLNFPISNYRDLAEQQETASAFQKLSKSTPAADAKATELPAAKSSHPVRTGNMPMISKGMQGTSSAMQAANGRGWTVPVVSQPYVSQEDHQALYRVASDVSRLPDGSMATRDTLYWCPQHKKWRAQLQIGQKAFHLGYFDDKSAAAQAYEKAVSMHCETSAPRIAQAFQTDSKALSGCPPAEGEQFEGVRWSLGWWEAITRQDNSCVSLGYFKTRDQALQAYNEVMTRGKGARGAQKRNLAAYQSLQAPDSSQEWRQSGSELYGQVGDYSALIRNGWGQKRRRGLSPN